MVAGRGTELVAWYLEQQRERARLVWRDYDPASVPPDYQGCYARVIAGYLALMCGVKPAPLVYPREALALPVALMGKMNLPSGKEPTPTQWIAAMSYIKPWLDELSRNAIRRVNALAAE
jgi:hypothetical protein